MDRDTHQQFYDGYESGHKVYYSLRPIEEIDQDEALNEARDETMLSIDSHFQGLSDEALAVLEAIFVSDVPIGEFISANRPQATKLDSAKDPVIDAISNNLTKTAINEVKTYKRKVYNPAVIQIPQSKAITRALSHSRGQYQMLDKTSSMVKQDRSLSYSNFTNAMRIAMNLTPHVSTEIFNLLCKGLPNKAHYLYDDLISSFTDIRSPLRAEFPIDAACAIYAQCRIYWLDLLNYLNARAGSVSEQQLGIHLDPVPTPDSFCHRLLIDTCLYIEDLDVYMTCSRDDLAQLWLPPHLNLSLGQMKHLESILKLDEVATHRFGLNREFFEMLLYDLTELTDTGAKTASHDAPEQDNGTKKVKDGYILTRRQSAEFGQDGRTKRAIETILNLIKFLDRMTLYDIHTEDISWLIKLSNTDNSIASYLKPSNTEPNTTGDTGIQEKPQNKVDFSLIRSLTNPDIDKTVLPLKDNANLPRLIVEDRESRVEAYKDSFTYSLVTAIRDTDNALISLRPRGNKIRRTLKPEVLAHYGPKFVQDLIKEEEEERQRDLEMRKNIELARGKHSNKTLLIGHSRLIKDIRKELGVSGFNEAGNAVGGNNDASERAARIGSSTPARIRHSLNKDWADSVTATEEPYEPPDTMTVDYRSGFCGVKYMGRTISGTGRSTTITDESSRALSARPRPSSTRPMQCTMHVASQLSNSVVLSGRRDGQVLPRLDSIDEGTFAARMRMLSRPASLSAHAPGPPPSSKQSASTFQRTRFNKQDIETAAHAVEHPLSKLKTQYLQGSQGDTKNEQNCERTRQILKTSETTLLRQTRAATTIKVQEHVNPLYERLERHRVMAEMEKSAKSEIFNDRRTNTVPVHVTSWASAAVYDKDNDCLIISCEVGCIRLYRISKDFDLIKKIQVAETALNTLCSISRTISMLSINEYADALKLLFMQIPSSTTEELLNKFNLKSIKSRLWSAITNDHYIYTSEGFGIYDDYIFNVMYTMDLGRSTLDLSTTNLDSKALIFRSTDEKDVKQHYISGLDFAISLAVPGYLSPRIAPRQGERPCKSKLFVSTTSDAIYFQLGNEDILRPAAVVTNYLGDPYLTTTAKKADSILLGQAGSDKFESLLNDGPPIINYKTLREYDSFGSNTRRIFHSISVYNFYVLYNFELLLNYIRIRAGEIAKLCQTNNRELIQAFFKKDLSIKVRGEEDYVGLQQLRRLRKRPAKHISGVNFSEDVRNAEGTAIDDIVQGVVEQIFESIEPIDSDSALSPMWKGATKGIASFMNGRKNIWITCNRRWHSLHDNTDVLVTGLSNGDAILWNLVTLRPRIILHVFPGFDITSLAFDVENNILYCSSVTGSVRIYNYDVTQTPIAEFKESASVLEIFYSQSSDLIIVVLVNGTVSLWSNKLYQQVSRISTHITPTTAEWDERNSLLLVCSREIKVFRLVGAEVNQEAKRVEKARESKLRRHRQREEEKQTISLYGTGEDPKESSRREIYAEDPLDSTEIICNMGSANEPVLLGQRDTSVINLPSRSLDISRVTTGYRLVPVTMTADSNDMNTALATAISEKIDSGGEPYKSEEDAWLQQAQGSPPELTVQSVSGSNAYIRDDAELDPSRMSTIIPNIADSSLAPGAPIRLTQTPLQTTLVRRKYRDSDLAYMREGGDRPDNHINIAAIRQIGLDGRIEPSKYNVHDPCNAAKPMDLDKNLLRAHWASIVSIIDVSYYTTLSFNEVELLTLDLFKGLDDNLITFQSACTFGPRGGFFGINNITIAPKAGVTTFAFNMGEDATQKQAAPARPSRFKTPSCSNTSLPAAVDQDIDSTIDPSTSAGTVDTTSPEPTIRNQILPGQASAETFTVSPHRNYTVSHAARTRGYDFALARAFNQITHELLAGGTRNFGSQPSKPRIATNTFNPVLDSTIVPAVQKTLMEPEDTPSNLRTFYSTYEPKTDSNYKLLPDEVLLNMKLFARPYRSMAYRPTPSSTSYMTKTNSQLRKELQNELHRRKSLIRIKFTRIIMDTYFRNIDFKTYEARVNLESQALRDETEGSKRTKDPSKELEAEKMFNTLVYKVDHSKRFGTKGSPHQSPRMHPHLSGRMISKGLYGNHKLSAPRTNLQNSDFNSNVIDTKTVITYRIGGGSEGGSPINSLISEMAIPTQPPSSRGMFRRRIPTSVPDTKGVLTFSASDLGSVVERTHLAREQSIDTLIARNQELSGIEENSIQTTTSETDKTEGILVDVPISALDSTTSTQKRKQKSSGATTTNGNTSTSVTSEHESTIHIMHTTTLGGDDQDLSTALSEEGEESKLNSQISSDEDSEHSLDKNEFEFKLFENLNEEVEKNSIKIEKELNNRLDEKRQNMRNQISKRKAQLEVEAVPTMVPVKQKRPMYTRLAARQAMNMRRKIAVRTSNITGIDIISQMAPSVIKKLDFLRDIISTDMLPGPVTDEDSAQISPIRRKENNLNETSIPVIARTKTEVDNFILKTEQERAVRYRTKFYTIDSRGNICLWLLEQKFELIYDSSKFDVQDLKDDTDDLSDDSTHSTSISVAQPSKQRPSSVASISFHGRKSSRLKKIAALTISTNSEQKSESDHARINTRLGSVSGALQEGTNLGRAASIAGPRRGGGISDSESSIFKRKDKIIEKPTFITSYRIELPDNTYITSASFDHMQSIILCGLSNGNALVYNIDLTEVTSTYHVSNCAKAAINFYNLDSTNVHKEQNLKRELLDFNAVLASGYFLTKFIEGSLRDYIFTCGRLVLCFCEDNTEKLSRKFVQEKLNEYMIQQDVEGLNRPPRAIMTGHTGGVICWACSKNYSHMITADDQGGLIYWQLIGVAKSRLYFPDQRILAVAFAAEEIVPGMAFLALGDGSIWIITPNCRYRLFNIGLPTENIGNNSIKITTTVVQVREVEGSTPTRQMLVAICVNNITLVFRMYANLKVVEMLRPDGTPSAVPTEGAAALADDLNRKGSARSSSADKRAGQSGKSNAILEVELNSIGIRVTPQIATEMAVLSSLIVKPLICYGPQCACCNISSVQFMTNNLGLLIGGTSGHAFYLPVSYDMSVFSKFYVYKDDLRTYSFLGFANIDRSVLLQYHNYRQVLSAIPTRELEVRKKNEFTMKLFDRLDKVDDSVKRLFNCQADDNIKDIIRPIKYGHVTMSNQIIRQNILKAYMLELMS